MLRITFAGSTCCAKFHGPVVTLRDTEYPKALDILANAVFLFLCAKFFCSHVYNNLKTRRHGEGAPLRSVSELRSASPGVPVPLCIAHMRPEQADQSASYFLHGNVSSISRICSAVRVAGQTSRN
jgi:hypothetical protein